MVVTGAWVGGNGPRGPKAHALRFGCDDAAIAGHLDVFDLTRSLVDWAPAAAEQRLGG